MRGSSSRSAHATDEDRFEGHGFGLWVGRTRLLRPCQWMGGHPIAGPLSASGVVCRSRRRRGAEYRRSHLPMAISEQSRGLQGGIAALVKSMTGSGEGSGPS